MRKLVGLTGGIASGKSVVAEMLRERGAVIVDSDVLARDVVERGTPALAAIRKRFGEAVLTPDGSLDRARLAEVVFADDRARADLNAIVHPAVRARAAELTRRAPVDAVVVHVIPLLVETAQASSFDTVVVVDVDPGVQIARLIARNGLSRADADARIAAQASREQRLAEADVVLRNDGSLEQLVPQVDALWRRLTGS